MNARFGLTLAVAGAAICCGGCGTGSFKEVHFYREAVESPADGELPYNYYRLTISGSSGFSSSRFVSGYFDDEVVTTYFNEVAQPKNAKLDPSKPDARPETPPQPSSPDDDDAADDDDAPSASRAVAGAAAPAIPSDGSGDGGVVEVGPDGKPLPLQGRALVLLLSTNADAIADQIGILTRTKEAIDSIALVANRGTLAGLQTSTADAAQASAGGKLLQAQGDDLVAGLKSDAAADVANANLLAYANALAAQLGADEHFASLADVEKWAKERNAGRGSRR